jgi:hypothetical protein
MPDCVLIKPSPTLGKKKPVHKKQKAKKSHRTGRQKKLGQTAA